MPVRRHTRKYRKIKRKSNKRTRKSNRKSNKRTRKSNRHFKKYRKSNKILWGGSQQGNTVTIHNLDYEHSSHKPKPKLGGKSIPFKLLTRYNDGNDGNIFIKEELTLHSEHICGGFNCIFLYSDTNEEPPISDKILRITKLLNRSSYENELKSNELVFKLFTNSNNIAQILHYGTAIIREDMYSIFSIQPKYEMDLLNYININSNTLTTPQKTNILFLISNGLQIIHDKKYVHLDLKPENIFMIGHVPYIGDFGFMGKIEGDDIFKGPLSGTSDYRDPELTKIEGTDPPQYSYTYGNDIWGFGRILLVMFFHEIDHDDTDELNVLTSPLMFKFEILCNKTILIIKKYSNDELGVLSESIFTKIERRETISQINSGLNVLVNKYTEQARQYSGGV